MSFGNGGAGGGITNSGIISGGLFGIGILAFPHPVSTFTGGITNSGTLKVTSPSGEGIFVNGVNFFGNAGGGGGITNRGVISAGNVGINVGDTTNLAGVIANSGTISAGGKGIFVGGGTFGAIKSVTFVSSRRHQQQRQDRGGKRRYSGRRLYRNQFGHIDLHRQRTERWHDLGWPNRYHCR